MVRDQTDTYVVLLVFLILLSAEAADCVADSLHRVDVEDRVYVLHDDGQPLEAHAGIDIFLLELGVAALAVALELGEDIVPDLHEAVAFAAQDVLGAVSVLDTAVVVDFGAGTAGTGPVLPEVVRLSVGAAADAHDLFSRNSDFLVPDFEGLVVVFIDRDVETLLVHLQDFGQEFPGPVNGLFLEVVAEGEIAQHLEECEVSCRLSDVFDIACPHALLAGCNSCPGRNLLAREIRLQGRHTRVDQKQGVVVLRYEGEGVHLQMSLALEKFQVHAPEIVHRVIHLFVPLFFLLHPLNYGVGFCI